MKKALSIAIDGPAASGKSTLAEALSHRLGYLYFDTGAMYRAVTLAALRRSVDIGDKVGLEALAKQVQIDLRPPSKQDGRLSDVLLDGEDVTWAIRQPEVDANVSPVSAVPGVRTALSQQQRRIGERGGVVMAGRDIGTVVLPNADLKIYLDASPEERARRRYRELLARGEEASYDDILNGIRQRDRIDSSRDIAPLRPAEDAIALISDGKDAHAVLSEVLDLVSKTQADLEESQEAPTYHLSWGKRLFRTIFRPIFRLIFRVLCRVSVKGRENMPERGPYIIAYNHISYFEPPFLLAFWPDAPEAVAGHDVFERPGVNILVRNYGAIPVHRDEYDRKVIELMMSALDAGHPLAIAPEGGRGHQLGLRQGRPGVAYLMDRARVPVVPVAIMGTYDALFKDILRGKRPPLHMLIGKPFNLPPIEGRGEDRRKARQANADLVMQHIAAQLPKEYWGVYKPSS